jgi:hypothetical protein
MLLRLPIVLAFFSDSVLHSAQGLRELHERGGTREDIEGALRIMPFASSPAFLFPDVHAHLFSSASRDDPWRQNAKGGSEATDDIPLSLQLQLCLYLDDPGST